ncbi:MAG: DUF4019 domain-containing protein [Casimicrobiaceae bacterium]
MLLPDQPPAKWSRTQPLLVAALLVANLIAPAASAALAPSAIELLAQAPAPAAAPPPADSENAPAITAATAASEKWLNALDADNLVATWQEAAEVFKLGVKQADWVTDLEAIRTQLGKSTMRQLKTTQYSTTLRGAPARGDYVTITFLTKFAKAPLASETLIVSKEADGAWRIAGYNIGKAPEQ